jgi:hypothetical protein
MQWIFHEFLPLEYLSRVLTKCKTRVETASSDMTNTLRLETLADTLAEMGISFSLICT